MPWRALTDSKAASMTMSALARSTISSVGVSSAAWRSACAALTLPRFTCLAASALSDTQKHSKGRRAS